MVAGLPKGATPLPKQAAYGIWVVPAGTYGHGSCGAGKGGGVEHPASSGSLPIPGMSSSCRDNHGQPQPTGMCCPHPVLSLILAWLLFPAFYLLVLGKAISARSQGNRLAMAPGSPSLTSSPSTIPGARHKIWELASLFLHLGTLPPWLKSQFLQNLLQSQEGASNRGKEITWDKAKPETGLQCQTFANTGVRIFFLSERNVISNSFTWVMLKKLVLIFQHFSKCAPAGK